MEVTMTDGNGKKDPEPMYEVTEEELAPMVENGIEPEQIISETVLVEYQQEEEPPVEEKETDPLAEENGKEPDVGGKKKRYPSWYQSKARKCCVPGCTADSRRSPELMFHYIPKREPKRSQWIRSMKIVGYLGTRPVVCNQHFKAEDYHPVSQGQKLIRLKITAIPSIREVPNIFENELSEEEGLHSSPKATRSSIRKEDLDSSPNEELESRIDRCKRKAEPKEIETSPAKEPKKNFVLKIKLKDPKPNVDLLSKSSNHRKKKAKVTPIFESIKNGNDDCESTFAPLTPCSEVETTLSRDKRSVKTEFLQQDEDITTFIYMPKTSGDILRLLPSHIKINIPGLKKEQNEIIKSFGEKKPKIEEIHPQPQFSEYTNVQEEVDYINISSDSDEGADNGVPVNNMSTENSTDHPSHVHDTMPEEGSDSLNHQEITRSESVVETITFCSTCGKTISVEDEELLDECSKSTKTVAAEILLQLQENSSKNDYASSLLMKRGIEICDKVLNENNIYIMDLVEDDNDLMAFTGVNSKLLDSLTELMSRAESDSLHVYSKPVRERIILCLCKIRTNLSFCCLAMLFKMTHRACANEFFTTIKALSKMLSDAIHWKKSAPECSKNNVPYKQTKVMLHCSEVKIEKKRCPACLEFFLSQNQISDSVKFVLGVAPSGLIVYKSKTFDSKTKGSIFTQTDLLQKLDPSKEAIMTDETLNIDYDCALHDISTIKLPTSRENREFSKNDVELIKNISAVRIHVNKSLQRFKTYKMLQTQIPWRIAPYIDNICTVVGAIVNMQHPVLSRDIFQRLRKSLHGSPIVL